MYIMQHMVNNCGLVVKVVVQSKEVYIQFKFAFCI